MEVTPMILCLSAKDQQYVCFVRNKMNTLKYISI